VVVANLGRGAEGTWSALDGRGVYAHASATDALYHADLRFELTRRLGVAWNPPDRGRADIAGIGPEARREFSRRSADIAAHLAERGWTGERAATVASHVTRADKDPYLAAEDLRPGWEQRALSVGLGPRRLEAVFDRGRCPSSPTMASDPEHGDLEATVGDALGQLRRAVTRRDVVRAWSRSLPAGAPGPEVEEAADRLLDRLAPASGPGGDRHGPGVAERRHQPPGPELGRRAGSELSRLLADRGIGLDRSDASKRHRDGGLGWGLG
jgi:hypothetical protein